ncbi:MAG: glycosyltransferase [Streptococcaceae bacterium]|jgi:GT2 family glycosyltransferase|nr:glycosyltransferase [Streptococcaceae bacterium]
MGLKVAIVIVTYKRQELLSVLYDSLRALVVKPWAIVVVDNENSQDTKALTEGLEGDLSGECAVHYVPMAENVGGAGGFSKGVETAYQLGADWIWVMDDDVKVFPEALNKLYPWLEKGVAAGQLAIQVRRQNFDGTDFYWQYDFKNHLGIPNPIAPAGFEAGETYKKINTMCFEGGVFHRELIRQIGFPDARFFIYWDDTVYGYLASKVTQPILINETLMARTRALNHVNLGKIRKLNATSDMARYYIMRNRGYMAQYFKAQGDYKPLLFGLGTGLTFVKEVIRVLSLSEGRGHSLSELRRGMKDGKKLRKFTDWKSMKALNPPE